MFTKQRFESVNQIIRLINFFPYLFEYFDAKPSFTLNFNGCYLFAHNQEKWFIVNTITQEIELPRNLKLRKSYQIENTYELYEVIEIHSQTLGDIIGDRIQSRKLPTHSAIVDIFNALQPLIEFANDLNECNALINGGRPYINLDIIVNCPKIKAKLSILSYPDYHFLLTLENAAKELIGLAAGSWGYFTPDATFEWNSNVGGVYQFLLRKDRLDDKLKKFLSLLKS